ncbi:MAG: hypothetical protein QXS38_00170 [Candidatus Pacearchaeota archaeon]
MNRGGQLGEQILVFAFIFLLVIIGGGIVIGTYLFIGSEFDFRVNEANILGYHIKNCLVSEGSDWLDNLKDKNNLDLLYEKCNLDKEVVERNNLIKICIGQAKPIDCSIEKDANKIVLYSFGDFEPCKLNLANNFLGCSAMTFGKYSIITTSKQHIRRISR